jgi:hypothetical protein
VQRWLKFAKLLPTHGWEPVVVTPANPDVPVVDPTLSEDVSEGLTVWRFPVWEPTRFLRRIGLGGSSSRLGADRVSNPSMVSKIVRWARGNLFVPDARVGWVRPTTKNVLQQLQRHPVHVVVTTGPPHSMHLIGLALKRATGLPWVADFRDPWSSMDYLEDFGLSKKSRHRISQMEREVVESADLVLVTSPGALQELRVDPKKGVVIPNGWDRDDFPASCPSPPLDSPRVLGHFGALYGSRNPKPLWPALAKAGWKLLLAGPVTPEVLKDVRSAGVDFTHVGDLPHKEAVKRMHTCHALLVTHNNSRSARSSTPGKLFESLASKRPVLVFGPPDSDLERRCIEEGLAFVAHQDDRGQSLALQWLLACQDMEVGRPNKDLKKFERHELTSELVAVFNAVLKS